MPAARGRRPRALRPQARAVCLAARGSLRRQRGHRLVIAAQRARQALLQRHRGRRDARVGVAEVSVPRPGAHHPVLDRDEDIREIHGADRGRGEEQPVKAVAIIDGEHYPDVVREALAELPYEFVGVMLVGGSEKLRGVPDYGVPLVTEAGDAEIAVDLSDEPVLDPRTRLQLASRFLADGIPYVGADFRFDPPARHPFDVPSLAVIGTGKRVGKTAVTGAVARALARDRARHGRLADALARPDHRERRNVERVPRRRIEAEVRADIR